jgi:hypothetical protein
MGRYRRDATLDEWLKHGDNLLTKLSVRSKLYKDIKSELAKLNNLNSAPEKDKSEIKTTLEKLNKTKTKFKAKDKTVKGEVKKGVGKNEWSLWIARIYQHKKDDKRSKFYVSNTCHEQVELMSEQSGYESLNKYLGQLPSVFIDNGIGQTRDLFDLRDLLTPFQDALKPVPSNDLHTEDREPEFSLLAIVKAITEELSRLGIKDYHKLSSINKTKREADKYAESIRGQLNEMQQQIELKDERLKSNNIELLDLKNTINHLEAEKEKLLINLKKCNNRKARRKL